MARTTPEDLADLESVDLAGMTVVVTGATDGIGRETARSLGRLGARVLVHGRDAAKADRVVAEIKEGPGSAERFLGDFCEESAVLELATSVLERADTIDVLVNNAGAHFETGRLNEAGIECTFAVNHIAPFVLTNLLAPSIEATGGRIVTVASGIHHRTTFDLDAMTTVQGYDGLDAYSQSKFANVLFTYALSRRLDAATTNCLHPGFVPGSALWRHGQWWLRWLMGAMGALPAPIQNLVGKTPSAAAATPVYLAASPAVEGLTGEYFADLQADESAPRTYDRELQEELWDRSAELVSIPESDLLT